jgi:hypothetical protein
VRGIGHHKDHGAVVGTNDGGGVGVFGESNANEGVRGVGHSRDHGAVVGTNDGGGPGVFGKGNPAGFFDGDVTVTGDLKVRGASLGPEQIQALGQQVTGLQQQVTSLQQVTGFQQQVTSLHQLVNNLEAQLASLQSKQAKDEQDTAIAVATLAARITSLGG